MTQPAKPDIASLTFEQALAELEEIVRTLEQGEMDLDASIAAYQRGAELKAHCETKLREAQMKVDRIVLGSGGQVGTEPTDMA